MWEFLEDPLLPSDPRSSRPFPLQCWIIFYCWGTKIDILGITLIKERQLGQISPQGFGTQFSGPMSTDLYLLLTPRATQFSIPINRILGTRNQLSTNRQLMAPQFLSEQRRNKPWCEKMTDNCCPDDQGGIGVFQGHVSTEWVLWAFR